jgi:hypothetical protein
MAAVHFSNRAYGRGVDVAMLFVLSRLIVFAKVIFVQK